MNTQVYIYIGIFLVLIIIMSNLDKVLGLFPKENLSSYKLQPALFSKAEINFYRAFMEYKKDTNPVFAKVRLADVFSPSGKGKAYMSDFNKISAKHVDFLVCDKETMKPLYAIELDDKSHLSEKAKKRDDFVGKLFAQTGLALVRVQARKDYSDTYLDELFSVLDDAKKNLEDNKISLCPKCGVPMILRTSKRGDKAGKQFLGCPNYPKCKMIIELKDE